MTQEEYYKLRRLDKIRHLPTGKIFTVKRLDKTTGLIICYDDKDDGEEQYFFYHLSEIWKKYNKPKPGKEAAHD